MSATGVRPLPTQVSPHDHPFQGSGTWHGPGLSPQSLQLPYSPTTGIRQGYSGHGQCVAPYSTHASQYPLQGQHPARDGVYAPDRSPTYTRPSPGGLPINTSNGIVRQSKTRVYVHGLRTYITANDVRILFSKAGEVLKCELPIDRRTQRPKGYASIQFKTESEANNAIRMFNGSNGGYAQSRTTGTLTVRFDKSQPPISDTYPTIVRSEPRPR